jgi:hypothetical protein
VRHLRRQLGLQLKSSPGGRLAKPDRLAKIALCRDRLVMIMVHRVLAPIIPVAPFCRESLQEIGKGTSPHQVNHTLHLQAA